MIKFFRVMGKFIPTLILSIFLALTVWIIAVTQADPTEERRFTNPVTVELRGLAENLIMTNTLPETVNVLMRAPTSTWATIVNQRIGATAVIDVSGLEAGEHTVPIAVEIDMSPVQVTSFAPQSVKVVLEAYETRTYDVNVQETGTILTAYKAELPVADPAMVNVSGPVSVLDQIEQVRVILDINNATEPVTQNLVPAAIRSDGTIVTGNLKFSTDRVKVTQNISLRGGYRVVVVKVATAGASPRGYVLEGLSVSPAVATIYSSDRVLLDSLPGFIETNLITLRDFTEETTVKTGLKLPGGVTLVGDQAVNVTIQVAPVESSRTISNVPIQTIGVEDGFSAVVSPSTVDVFLTGPLLTVEGIRAEDLTAVIALHDKQAGTYQLTPSIDVSAFDGVNLQSVSPMTVDVTISKSRRGLGN